MKNLFQGSATIISALAVLAVVFIYLSARFFSVASRKKRSIFSNRKNQYKDCTRKKKNFDGTVHRRFRKRNKRT